MIDDNNILCSWIHEYSYCPKRFYIKVMENNNPENIFVAEGSADHTSVHKEKIERRKTVTKVTGLQVYSKKLNIYGICDRVDFIKGDNNKIYVPFLKDYYQNINVVEYKHGKKRKADDYALQLASQIMCIEEMYECIIQKGFIYYTSSKQQQEIAITDFLKNEVVKATVHIRDMLNNKEPPSYNYKRTCNFCSVYELCRPRNVSTEEYLKKLRKKYMTNDTG